MITVKAGRYGDLRWRGHLDMGLLQISGRSPSVYTLQNTSGGEVTVHQLGRSYWLLKVNGETRSEHRTKSEAQEEARIYVEVILP